MSDLKVKIEKLPAMRVASAYGFGESPEGLAAKKMQRFVAAYKLTDAHGNYFTYGFNNPSPAPGSPNYGYEIWLPVGTEITGDEDISIKEFSGGLYAVTRFTGLSKIGAVWHELVAWRERSAYHSGKHQWLELLHNPTEPDYEKYTFDLYLPLV